MWANEAEKGTATQKQPILSLSLSHFLFLYISFLTFSLFERDTVRKLNPFVCFFSWKFRPIYILSIFFPLISWKVIITESEVTFLPLFLVLCKLKKNHLSIDPQHLSLLFCDFFIQFAYWVFDHLPNIDLGRFCCLELVLSFFSESGLLWRLTLSVCSLICFWGFGFILNNLIVSIYV